MMKAYLVAGLGFGDEGKGSIVDALVRKTGASLVVRYNGGPQAAHNVVTKDGLHHEFHQFGSGSLVSGVGTYLSRYMLIEPFSLLNEGAELAIKTHWNPYPDLFIEDSCRVITPFHWITNRLREKARGDQRHGSCGMGVGEVREDELLEGPQLLARDLMDWDLTKRKLLTIQAWKIKQVATFEDTTDLENENVDDLCAFYKMFIRSVGCVRDGSLRYAKGPIVFEGAQGMLLDEAHGFHPYTTWSNCTFDNARSLLMECPKMEAVRIGVLRTYLTRHGPGPFVSESPSITFSDHNQTGEWQGPFRQGHFDMVMAKYALRMIGGVDYLALTHCDRFPTHRSTRTGMFVDGYYTPEGALITRLEGEPARLTQLLQQVKPRMVSGCLPTADLPPIGIASWGPLAQHKEFKLGEIEGYQK